jgi:hypothetical protein
VSTLPSETLLSAEASSLCDASSVTRMSSSEHAVSSRKKPLKKAMVGRYYLVERPSRPREAHRNVRAMAKPR